MLAELAVLLVVRNPSVSPFYALAVLFYPVFETGFSIWRRRFKRGVPVDQPDALHLHQLVFRRLVRVTFSRGRRHAVPALCNALASPYMWVLALIGLVPATIWGQRLDGGREPAGLRRRLHLAVCAPGVLAPAGLAAAAFGIENPLRL